MSPSCVFSHLLVVQSIGSNMFKMLFHGLSLVLLSTLTSHPALGHFIGYPSDNKLSSKTLVLVYKYLTTGQPKYFAPYLSLYTSAVNTRHSNPKICSSRFLIIVLPSINERSTPTTVSHMMPLSYGMIFHMISAVLQISSVSKVD